MAYAGRFAPSPTGPLHAGSLVAALASWLDARAHGAQARWLIRIEDLDAPRCPPGMDQHILGQLAACHLMPDDAVQWQSQRTSHYQAALDTLVQKNMAYPCACSRQDIASAHASLGHVHTRNTERPYPGTCRGGLKGKAPRSWRFHTGRGMRALHWHDRRMGPQCQDVETAVGDFTLLRADGIWAYQLAVVVDDADQGITHVVRGADLADNTPRQMLLQKALGAPLPVYLHTPVLMNSEGEKLSKQNGAPALDLTTPLNALSAAAQALGLPNLKHYSNICISDALALWVTAWAHTYNGAS